MFASPIESKEPDMDDVYKDESPSVYPRKSLKQLLDEQDDERIKQLKKDYKPQKHY
jgi:hypothetical protein